MMPLSIGGGGGEIELPGIWFFIIASISVIWVFQWIVTFTSLIMPDCLDGELTKRKVLFWVLVPVWPSVLFIGTQFNKLK